MTNDSYEAEYIRLREERRERLRQEGRIIDEQEYIDAGTSYALHVGIIKKEEIPTLTEQYFKPIYAKYREVIEDVKKELGTSEDAEFTLYPVIRKLNAILERTYRIGSADKNNIIKGIHDFYTMHCCNDEYAEYATAALKQCIEELL